MPLGTKAAFAAARAPLRVIALCPQPDPDWYLTEAAYKHLPMPDGKHVPERLLPLVNDLTEELDMGTGVLVYCNAGRNRTALLLSLLLIAGQGYSGAEAIAAVRARRPNALANPYFTAYLEAL